MPPRSPLTTRGDAAAHPRSVQERYAPENHCFGCGPANDQGLRIRSFPGQEPGELVCSWQALPHHLAFGNVLNGGIIATLLDCHSNWTAALHLMARDGLDGPACTVTLDLNLRLRRPTPLDQPVRLVARPVAAEADRVRTEATLTSGGKLTATCTGTFVAVQPGHPAHHRW